MERLVVITFFMLDGLWFSGCMYVENESENGSGMPASQQVAGDAGYRLREDVDNINEHLDYSEL